MATRVNTRFVILLTSVLAALVLGMVGFWYVFVQQSPADLMHRGDQLMADGAPQQAVAYYGRALRNSASRTNLELIDKYTAALETAPVQDLATAEQHLAQHRQWLRRAAELHTDDASRLERYYALELRVAQQWNERALYRELHELTEARLATNPDSLVARKYRGIAQVHLHGPGTTETSWQQARHDLQAARAGRPADAQVLHYLARWHLITNEANQALALSQAMLADDPDDPQRRLKRLQILTHPELETPDTATTEAARQLAHDLAGYFSTHSQPTRHVLALVEVLRRLEDESAEMATAARELLAAAVDAEPEDAALRDAFSQLLARLGEHDAAIAQLQALRQAPLDAPPLTYLRNHHTHRIATSRLADLLLMRVADTDDANQRRTTLQRVESLLEELAATSPDSATVKMLQGRLAMEQGETAQAALAFEAAIKRFDPPPRSLLLLAAHAHRRLNNWGMAIEHLRTLLDRNAEDHQVRRQLAAMQIQHGRVESAAAHIDVLLRHQANAPEVRELELYLIAARGELDNAVTRFHALPTEAQRRALPALVRACITHGQRDLALELLNGRLERYPADLTALQLMIALAPDQVRDRELLARADAAEADPDVLDMLSHQLEHGPEAASHELMRRLIDQQHDPLERALLQARLASQVGDTQRLRAAIEESAAVAPDHERVIELQFELALHDEQWDRAARLAATAATRNLDLAQGAFFRARLAAAHDQLPEASAHYRQALAARPVYADGWSRFGDVLSELGDRSAAVDAYRRALQQQPDHIAAHRGLAAIFIRQGEHDAARAQLHEARQYAPTDAALLHQSIVLEQAHGDPARTLALRRRLARIQPGDQVNRRAMALQLAENGQHDAARQVAEQLIDEHGESLANLRVLAEVHRQRGAPEVGDQLLTDAIAQRGEDLSDAAYITLARYRINTGHFDRAIDAYRAGMQQEDPEQQPVTRDLAELLFRRGMHNHAAPLLAKLYEANPDDSAVAPRYGEALVRTGQLNEAQRIVDRLDQSPTATALRGMLAGRQGELDTGIAWLTEAIAQQDNAPGLHLERARLRLVKDDLDGALADLARVLERAPDLVEARRLQAEAYVRRGELDQATAALDAALTRSPAMHEVRLDLVRLHTQTGDMDEAARLLDEAATQFPEDPRWPREQAALAARQNEPAEAARYGERLVEMSPTAAHLTQLADYRFAAAQPGAVVTLLRTHADTTAQHATLQARLARALAATDQSEQADQVFVEALRACEGVQATMQVAAQIAAVIGPEATVERFETSYGFLPELWRAMAASAIDHQGGRSDRVVHRLTPLKSAAAEAAPQVRWHYYSLLAGALHREGEPAAARAAYEQVRALNPEHWGTLNNLAYLLAEELDKADEALPLAERAAALAPGNPQVLDTLGWVQFRAGEFNAARRSLERSLGVEPLPETALHLGRVYRAMDEPDRARAQWELAARLAEQIGNGPVLSEARRELEQSSRDSSR